MISFYYSNRLDNNIFEHEESMLIAYTLFVKEYEAFFKSYGCSIKTGLMWKRLSSEAQEFQRGQFQNGYECYVYCSIEKDGREVRISSNNGEVDYYPLSTAWLITSIHRSWWRLKVHLFTGIDTAAINDVNEFKYMLQHAQ